MAQIKLLLIRINRASMSCMEARVIVLCVPEPAQDVRSGYLQSDYIFPIGACIFGKQDEFAD